MLGPLHVMSSKHKHLIIRSHSKLISYAQVFVTLPAAIFLLVNFIFVLSYALSSHDLILLNHTLASLLGQTNKS